MEEARCKHAVCQCSGSEVRRDGYCSDACRDEREAGGACSCGHPACRIERRRQAAQTSPRP